jgi:tetratricopeptide (TPR) repeat protein
MADTHQTSSIMKAIEALKIHDRKATAKYLREALENGEDTGERWHSVARLAGTIGEIEMEIEAMRRFSQTTPVLLERILAYCEVLARYGRVQAAFEMTSRLSEEMQTHPMVLHFLGTVATQIGAFDRAEPLLRAALEQTPMSAATWHSLSILKTFVAGDPDIDRMEALLPEISRISPSFRSQHLYTLGKAYDDIGLKDKAADAYLEGAALIRAHEPYDHRQTRAFDADIIKDFTPDNLSRLKPSNCNSERIIFVNGLPRSGTTLVEQILTRHSAVRDGAELNLLRAALIPTQDFSWNGAMAYQTLQEDVADPWGELARDYLDMVTERFGPEGLVVDKTLNHARFMGLLIHTLPNAKVIWVRRNPEDCALSCFRTYFNASTPWSWSLVDIAAYFLSEDKLYQHWSALYPDRIMTVPYEGLVSDPEAWIPQILTHVGLALEDGIFNEASESRSITTASVVQARQPISSHRIGSANTYADLIKLFRTAYQ